MSESVGLHWAPTRIAASAIHRVESIDVIGPQNLKRGNWPSRPCHSPRRVEGSVQMSGSLRPSAGYIGRGVTVKSAVEYIAYHQQMLAHVNVPVPSRLRATSHTFGRCTSLLLCRQNLISHSSRKYQPLPT